ncbi:hypothetical protein R5R35_008456 [Gryllus longicercus]|uniref:Uncharacterized protein n=1 Tax=Gryllus longicercus TaxID=2509291 RepID=A0AAN9Z4S7_9ORTH
MDAPSITRPTRGSARQRAGGGPPPAPPPPPPGALGEEEARPWAAGGGARRVCKVFIVMRPIKRQSVSEGVRVCVCVGEVRPCEEERALSEEAAPAARCPCCEGGRSSGGFSAIGEVV